MEYREIVAVTGIGGLFQLMATKSDGAIVRNLADKSTKFIPARLHNVTPLESIEVYTTSDNVRLHEVFQKMKDNPNTPLPDTKKADNNTIKGYFKSIFPEFDEERVYVSDMKKMLKWYDLLKENNLLDFEALLATSSEQIAAEEPAAVAKEEEKPVKKTKEKKISDAVVSEEGTEKVPAKKTARKKKTTEDAEVTEGGEKPAPVKKAPRKKKED